ncbi:ribosomal protein S18 acetylase RimI-like enzyme [Deinococcus metalli]|uniref:N-acetyltransferase n=1 Tax=Deinococcus metalli TaxID=1141878 RepID=A0A7W8KIE3_9DEIO|nr:GNAT family N-acetyltransferase [Deinococcus metalli]MBB5377596.1 ribosomal protein S18 acetylase RimI-like enzyme [Deinococcus metalli]GHF51957.1 N-acetyltransferase [Deinococcus metalli]
MSAPTPPATFVLRDPRVPDDYGPMAAVLRVCQPDWPVTPEDLEREDRTRDPALYQTRVVAEQDGRIVGVGGAGHDDRSFEEWRYWGGVNVHPDARGQGIGSALYDELLRRLTARGARELRTGSSDRPHDAPGRAFLERRGFAPAWERYESRIDTRTLDLASLDGVLAQVEAQGVQLRSLTDLAGDPERDRKLWELDWLLFQDIPMGTVFTKKAMEQWVTEELGDPHLAPELSFVAVRPGADDPLTGDYVGYSTLGRSEPGQYYIGMTGVLRSGRGRGIAKALKVAAMRALQAQGGGVIKTFNDPPNTAMLGMNAALGFVRTATRYRYEKRLDGDSA